MYVSVDVPVCLGVAVEGFVYRFVVIPLDVLGVAAGITAVTASEVIVILIVVFVVKFHVVCVFGVVIIVF